MIKKYHCRSSHKTIPLQLTTKQTNKPAVSMKTRGKSSTTPTPRSKPNCRIAKRTMANKGKEAIGLPVNCCCPPPPPCDNDSNNNNKYVYKDKDNDDIQVIVGGSDSRKPAANDDAVAVVTPAKRKVPTVSVQMLRNLARDSADRAASLVNYEPRTNNDGGTNADENALLVDEHDSDIGPIFLSWANRSTTTDDLVKSLTNFSVAEFRALWMEIQHDVVNVWNVGSGRRSTIHPMDAFLMTVSQMKSGTTFDNTACAFGCRANMFCCVFETFVEKCGAQIFDSLCSYDTMGDYRKREVAFAGHPDAIEAIDVTFQKAYARGEDFVSKKIRFSGKHKAYGIKTEIAVGPDGRARFVGAGYPGSFHDMKIFCSHLAQHLERLQKDKANARDNDNLTIDNPDECYMWAAMMDRGYEGACHLGCFLSPKKRLARTELDGNDVIRNNKLEQDCVIVENYFGRMKQLWGQMEKTF